MKKLIFALLMVVPCAAWGVDATFTQGVNSYTGCTDTKMKSNAATTNYGSGTDLEIGWYDTEDKNNSIVRFDLSSITGPVTVSSATIALYQTESASSGNTLSCYTLLRNFNVSQATWDIYSTGNSWSTVGGAYNDLDRASTSSVDVVVGNSTGWVYFASAQLMTDVQNMINGTAPNYGWIFAQTSTLTRYNYHTFSSADAASNKPTLTITYTTSGGGSSTVTVPSQILLFN